MKTWNAVNPATGEQGETIHSLELHDMDEVMKRAQEAFERWSRMDVRERLPFFRRLRYHLTEQLDAYAREIAWSTGKPLVEAAATELLVVIDSIRYIEKHAIRALRDRKVKTPIILIGKKSTISYEPRGTVLVISPWNYPFLLAMAPMLSALIAGNAVILKPSEVTPLVGKLIAEAFAQAGFPEGLVQLAQGDGSVGAALIAGNPDYIVFTGSVQTGKRVQQEAAKRLIPTTLELGGKDPMIVFADAHIERAVRGAVWGALTNSGQTCMAVERLYVQRPIYKSFVGQLQAEVEQLLKRQGGDGDLGSMTFPKQVEIVKEHLADALVKGAELVQGLKPETWNTAPDQGLYLEPIILTNVSPDMRIMSEETFGPVICVAPFDTEEEAIALANDSSYGLNASVWTRDLAKGRRCAAMLQSGMVCVNTVIVNIANPYLPYGGVKNSGVGRVHGDAGLRMFCQEKSVVLDSGRQASEINWYPYTGKYSSFIRLIQGLYGKRRSLAGFSLAFLELLRKSKSYRK